MEDILRIINSDPELKAKFETAVDNYCNSRDGQLVLEWVTKKHNLTGDQMEALTFALEWADSHTNWISVEDGLPKEDGTYLFYDAGTQGVYVSYFWADLELNEKVTHWMRIKKPGESVTTCNHKTSSSSEIPTNCQSVTQSNQLKGGKQ